MEIKNHTITIYREVYYEHVKPLIRKGAKQIEIDNAILPILVMNLWTLEMYHEMSFIDFMQRINYINHQQNLKGRKNFKVLCGNEKVVADRFATLPKLRCPILSEDIRPILKKA